MTKQDVREGAAEAPRGDARRLGRYRLFAKLGSGGQAEVFLAVAEGSVGVDKLVVIKKAPKQLAEDGDRLAMFLDEARLASKLTHPNVVHTYEVGKEDGAYFIAMEYLEGQPLNRLIRAADAKGLTVAMRVRIVADALRGLHHAHCLRDYDGKPLGIVHRDISPHNIFVTYEGVTKIVDFGIAKATLSASETMTGVVKGKTAYMSPEQAGGSTDLRSDVFSMGIVLWELLTRKRLFEGDALTVLQKLVYKPIPRVRTAAPEIDAPLESIVAKALAKDPEDRYQTADDMREALEAYLRIGGQIVRDLEVGQVVSSAFQEARAKARSEIGAAMTNLSAKGDPGDLPSLDAGGISPSASSRVGPALVAASAADAELTARVPPQRALVTTKPAARGLSRMPLIAGGVAATVVAWIAIVVPKMDGSVAAAQAPSAPSASAAAAGKDCKTPISVRVLYDMTGATKEVGVPAGKGELDYLRAINDAGGIRGCKIDIAIQDTKYDKGATLDAYNTWKSAPAWSEVSTVFVQGTPMTQVLGPLATRDQKVIISGSYAGDLAAPSAASVEVQVPSLNGSFSEASVLVRKTSPGYPFVFFQGTDYSTAARVGANFAWKQGSKRMGFFYCTSSPFCTDPVDGVKTFLKLLGGTKIGRDLPLELADDEATVERKVMQYFREERARKAAHADYQPVDWIWFGNTRVNAAHLGRALKKAKEWMGAEVHVIADNWAVDEALGGLCGEACNGFHVVQPYAMFGDLSAPGMMSLLNDHQRYRKTDGDSADGLKVAQYVYGRVAVATWKIAVERLLDAGKPVTGPDLRAELEKFQNVDVEGFASISYSPTDHRPQSGARIAVLGPKGRLDTVGQPLSLSLQPAWLGW